MATLCVNLVNVNVEQGVALTGRNTTLAVQCYVEL